MSISDIELEEREETTRKIAVNDNTSVPKLRDMLEKIPDDAIITGDDYGMIFEWGDLETDDEFAVRVARQIRSHRTREESQLKRDREEFERLKQKLGE